jgi:hypothetical protein
MPLFVGFCGLDALLSSSRRSALAWRLMCRLGPCATDTARCQTGGSACHWRGKRIRFDSGPEQMCGIASIGSLCPLIHLNSKVFSFVQFKARPVTRVAPAEPISARRATWHGWLRPSSVVGQTRDSSVGSFVAQCNPAIDRRWVIPLQRQDSIAWPVRCHNR